MDRELESIYTARLMKIQYRTKTIHLQEPINKRQRGDFNPSIAVPGVRMGFDSGSDLTYLTKKIYNDVVKVVSFALALNCIIISQPNLARIQGR